ncbi:GTPase activating protein [Mucor velutinosus]|uniref:Long-chain-alcohol oxidase n=1 Tax=Mucor velutinosus TaxID=708070 RepID=A0AAN7DC26_9FUNG|nr:GTPase activating protein [Mucor velutinosus]
MVQTKYPPMELSSSQANMLGAIFDTVLAQLTPEEEQAIKQKMQGKEGIYHVSMDQVAAISRLSATSLQIPSVVVDFFSSNVAPDKRADLVRVLDILATRPGSLLLTGYWKPMPELSRQQREDIMLKWKNSSLPSLRNLFKVLSNLCLYNAYSRTHSPLIDSIGHNAANGDAFFENHPDYDPVEHERIPMMQTEEATRGKLEFDVVVVGSGAGGGVAAAELAKAGYSVLVIEKGKYYHQSEMAHEEETCYTNMYDGGTSTTSTSGSIQCLSGATLGGGTALNYLVSLKPQHFVREEWAKQGLSYFASPQFSRDLDKVFGRIGASQENMLETKTNSKFEKGCHELGYHIEKVFVNTGGRAHHCSRCMMGCKSGIKNSTANTWLLDALHHGARFLDRTFVTRVVTNNRGTKAIGVECQIHDAQQPVFIKAKKVIVACGALRTPGLLKSSGLSNSNIGKHLRLQPIMFGFGFFDEAMRQMDGPLISRVCNASDDCHGDHYGAKIEEGLMLPGGLASKIPWYGAAKHKELMLRHKSVASFVNVVRDKDSVGVVTFDPSSPNPVYEYALSKHDAKSLTVCIQRNMRILAAAGARELYTSQANVEGFAFNDDEESSADNPRFNQWLDRVSKAGISAVSTPLVSVHQLGSCRMGTSPKLSVVQPTGETWECKHIYIADGSVFPTAVGVNPMVTIEAIALHVSRNVISTLASSARL